MKGTHLYILGVGGHFKVILEMAILSGYNVVGIYDDNPDTHNREYYGIQVYGSIDMIKGCSSVIAIGNNKVRKDICSRLDNISWQKIIHPSAIISKDVKIGDGTVIMAGAIVQKGANIGKHCIINTGTCIDHDCQIEDYVHVAPNSTLAGGVKIEEGVFVGIGSSIMKIYER